MRSALGCGRAAWALEDDNFRRRAALRRLDLPARHRRCDQWRAVPRLCGTGLGANVEAGRCRHHGQPQGPQDGRYPPSDRGVPCNAAVHSALYSDLNPIELAFSKLKALLRAKAIRTTDALWQAVGELYAS